MDKTLSNFLNPKLKPLKHSIVNSSLNQSIKKGWMCESNRTAIKQDTLDTEKNSRSDQELTTLQKKIQQLNVIVQKQQKEIDYLKLMNQYLIESNQSKQDMLAGERKLRQVQSQKVLNQKAKEIPVLTQPQIIVAIQSSSRNIKPRLEQVKTEETSRSRPSFMNLDRLKTGIFNFVAGEETFKISSVMNINRTDEEVFNMYNEDCSIQIIKDILSNEDDFIELMQNAKQQKLSFIYDKLTRIFGEHHDLFKMLIRFKKIIKSALQMTQQLLFDDVINSIVDEMPLAMECERATCFIYDQEKNELWSRVAKGTQSVIKLQGGQGIAGSVVISKEMINIRNAYSDPRFNQDIDKRLQYKTKTLLVCPVIEGDRCIGVLQCLNKQMDGHFTKEDEQLMQIFAEFASVVIGNAISRTDENIYSDKYRHMISTALLLGNHLTDKIQLIKTAQYRIQGLLNIESCRICYISADRQSIFHIDNMGLVQKNKYFLQICMHERYGEGLLGEAMTTNKVKSCVNCYKELNFNSQIDMVTNLPVMVIPICSPQKKEDVIGALQVLHYFISFNQIVLVKSIYSSVIDNELRLNRRDSDIIELYTKLIGEFLHMCNKGQSQIPE